MVGEKISGWIGRLTKKKPDNHGPLLSKKLSVSFPKSDNYGVLAILVGVRGSGKTTLLKNLATLESTVILKPSTTRQPRSNHDDEYHFVTDWNTDDYAWEVSIGEYKYGMLHSELGKAKDKSFALTIFDPSAFDVLATFRENSNYDILTIGLDTIEDIDEQSKRVSGDKSRLLTPKQLEKQRDIVRNCDILSNGDEEEVKEAIEAAFQCLMSRGGIVQRSLISKLLPGNVLLTGATKKVQPASYDLRLGDDVWCQGKFITLDDKHPVLNIPAYSYAIVSSKEMANLPSFISARFDLKNSLFFKGVILSNGPQIDPGYRGALFCMLYNGSDKDIGIAREQPFSTIEFITTAGVDIGYREKYQGKTRLKDFMPPDAAVSKGGQILERTEKKIEEIDKEWKNFRSMMIALLALIISPSLIVYFNLLNKFDQKTEQLDATLKHLNVVEHKLNILELKLRERVQESNTSKNIKAEHTKKKLD